MIKSDPLLLLDNGTLAYILGNGEWGIPFYESQI